jgi:PKD repeat protein
MSLRFPKQLWAALLLVAMLWAPALKAQHFCGTEDRDTYLARLSPEQRTAYEQVEAQIQAYALSKRAEVQNNPLWRAHRYDTVKYVIPCVVHVVHRPGTTQLDSLPKAIILDQMNRGLHKDFRALPGTNSYGHKAVDMRMEFNLATLDPQGNPTDGILYHADNDYADADQALAASMKAEYNWDQTKYFNIWVVNDIEAGGQIVLGFARFPVATGTPYTDDGIVVRHNNFSAKGDFSDRSYGRTTTHEIGHWINLFHTFQFGCSGGGDQVSDTPPEASAPIFGTCTRRYNRCNNDNPDQPENNKNYMGYLDDLAMNHFTLGQRTRAEAVFESANFLQRYSLWQMDNLEETGTGPFKAPAIADFYVSHRFTCPGQPVTFYDYSMGMPHEWEWTFPTADAGYQSSTERTPTVIFSTPGAHSATLRVTNRAGSKDTTIQGIVVVRNVAPKTLPFTVSFETGEVSDHYIANPDTGHPDLRALGALTWEGSGLGGAPTFGSRSMRMNHSVYCEYHARDAIVLPPVDLSDDTQDHASIAFSWSYRPIIISDAEALSRTYTDSLAVLASTDCGHTWELVHQMGGLDMDVNPSAALPFNSAGTFNFYGNRWLRDTISLNRFIGEANLQLKVEAINGYGNDLFLDGIRVENVEGRAGNVPIQVGRMRSRGALQATLAPNPFADHTQLTLALDRTQAATLIVMDVQGRTVYSQRYSQLPAGAHTLDVELHGQPAGVYMVRLRTDDGAEQTFKAIKR